MVLIPCNKEKDEENNKNILRIIKFLSNPVRKWKRKITINNGIGVVSAGIMPNEACMKKIDNTNKFSKNLILKLLGEFNSIFEVNKLIFISNYN